MSAELDQIAELRARGAVFFVSHSGGKDSQAMLAFVRQHVPDEQIVVIHADLPEADWPGVEEHIRATSPPGVEVIVCRATGKTFGDMVLRRGMFPSPGQRQCTSDLKRGPIKREIRRWLKRTGHKGLVVECMGLRAEESGRAPSREHPGSGRAKTCAVPLKLDQGNSKAGREWYTWLPVARMLVGEVFATIAAAGQEPHWAYQRGMKRLSCMFCIMADQGDLRTSAGLNPDVYARYVATERVISHTLSMSRRPLEEVTGVTADEERVRHYLPLLQARREALLQGRKP